MAAAVAFLFTGLTGALQIVPASEYGDLAKRWAGAPEPLSWNQPVPYSVHEQYDFKPQNLLGMVFPGIKLHFDPFVGGVALALVWIGVAAWWRDHRVRLMGAVSLEGLVYAMGHYSVSRAFCTPPFLISTRRGLLRRRLSFFNSVSRCWRHLDWTN